MYWKSKKDFVLSSVYTFITVFLAAVLPVLGDNEAGKSAIAAAVIVGLRLAVVAILQSIFDWSKNRD